MLNLRKPPIPTTGYYIMYDEHGEALWKSDPVSIQLTVNGDMLTIDCDPKLAVPGPLPASITWLVKSREDLLKRNMELERELLAARASIASARGALAPA